MEKRENEEMKTRKNCDFVYLELPGTNQQEVKKNENYVMNKMAPLGSSSIRAIVKAFIKSEYDF